MNGIRIIGGIHTPEDAIRMFRETGMVPVIGRNGARLVKKSDFKGFIYNDRGALERMAFLYDCSKGGAA